MSTARAIAKNFLSLTAANVVVKMLGLAVVLHLARALGPGDFGLANSAFATVGYFAMLAHLGINSIAMSELARGKADRSLYISNILSIKTVLGAAAFLLLVLLSFLSPSDRPDFRPLLLIYGLTIFTTNVLPPDWVFLSEEKTKYPAIATAGQAVLYAALILCLISGPRDLVLIPCALLLAQTAATAYLFLIFRRRFPSVTLRFDLTLARGILKETAPLGLSGIMAIIVSNTGLSMLGFVTNPEEAGYFSAAGKISGLFTEALMAYGIIILPPMARHYGEQRHKVEKLINYTLKGLAVFGIPAAAGISVLAWKITPLIYGERFMAAAPVLSLLIWSFILIFGSSVLYLVIVAAGRQNNLIKLTVIQAAAALALNALLIRAYGAYGAALATVLTGTLTLWMFLRETGKFLDVKVMDAFLKPGAAAAAMALALFPLRGASLALTIPLGAAVYAAAILVSGAITREDAETFKRILKRNDA
ncbi:MAG: hypothetical protein A2081_04345 [Elusimicrobia bacterium GWC2_61_19]|nr:MAG: hypothetical protein A2081_04345 [Elusimicrobia bacterium GWC2_61_19]